MDSKIANSNGQQDSKQIDRKRANSNSSSKIANRNGQQDSKQKWTARQRTEMDSKQKWTARLQTTSQQWTLDSKMIANRNGQARQQIIGQAHRESLAINVPTDEQSSVSTNLFIEHIDLTKEGLKASKQVLKRCFKIIAREAVEFLRNGFYYTFAPKPPMEEGLLPSPPL